MAYTKITQKEFEHTLSNLGKSGYSWIEWKEENSTAKETIYMVKINNIYVKIFSSIVDGETRPVGSDAIRAIGYDKESKTLMSTVSVRVNRTENWSENLKKAIQEVVSKQLDIKTCPIPGCGGKINKIKYKDRNTGKLVEFDGCTNYKNHGSLNVKSTEKLTEKDLEYWE